MLLQASGSVVETGPVEAVEAASLKQVLTANPGRACCPRCQPVTAPRECLAVQVEVDKPTGLKLGESKNPNGGLLVKVGAPGCLCTLSGGTCVLHTLCLVLHSIVERGVLAVQASTGNAAKAGIQAGDTIIYTSSFFGDELWPADKLGFANSAINACPSPVAFVYIKVSPLDQTPLLFIPLALLRLWCCYAGRDACCCGACQQAVWDEFQGSLRAFDALHAALAMVQGENTEVNVKRLPKKPTPPRFGRKLTAQQRERATNICLDCGYIYCDQCALPPSCPLSAWNLMPRV